MGEMVVGGGWRGVDDGRCGLLWYNRGIPAIGGVIMRTTVRATYSNGTLTPEIPLALDEGAEVTLVVETDAAGVVGERERRSAEERAWELREIGRRCARLLEDGPSAVEHGDWLYGEDGLPK